MSNLEASPSNSANSSSIILVTGINGYIASHIALILLQTGYTVRGTSRSATTLDRILSQPAFKPYASISPLPLQHVVISNITGPGVFDEAVKGCHAVIHTASPVDFKLTTTEAFMAPAIGGVISILQSVYNENKLHNGKIRSFVLTSSIAAIVDRWRHPPISEGGTENRAYTEADWNETGASVARKSEIQGPFLPMVAYGASKAAAERSMWAFADTHPDIQHLNLSLSSVNPGVNTGPPVNWPDHPDNLNATLLPVYQIWSGQSKALGKLPPQIGGHSYIDVRDAAALHVWCMEHPEQSSGNRYLATNGKAPPQACTDLLQKLYPESADRFFKGTPGAGYVEGWGWPDDEPTVKATKAYEAMGVQKFRSFEESIRDTIGSFREKWPELKL